MLIVILPVLIGTPLIAWRYRYGNKKARYTPNWNFSWKLDILIYGVPLAIVLVMSLWEVQNTSALDPWKPIKTTDAPLKVDVIGYNWKWLFVYPQLHIASVGQLVFPEHRQLAMRLTSDTVMQSFFIPTLGSQIYAMAAMTTQLHLMSNSTGQFLGENTMYSGMGFQHQKFIARATTPQGFRDWVARVKTDGIPLTTKVYDVINGFNTVPEMRGALKAGNMPPKALFFRDVNPDLFRNVVMSFQGGPSGSSAIVHDHSAPRRMVPGAAVAELAPRKTHHTGMTG